MKYQIVINQAGVVAAELHQHTDVLDWAILSHIYAWQANTKAVRNEKGMVWISLQNITSELPLIHLKSKAAISKRITDLKDLGLLETELAADGRLFAQTTELYESVNEYRTRSSTRTPPVRPDERPVRDDEQGPVRTDEHISNNHISSGTISGDAALPPGLNVEAWNQWIEYRKKAKLKKYKTDKVAKHLATFPPAVQQLAVNYSCVQNEYSGLFPERFMTGGKNGAQAKHDPWKQLDQDRQHAGGQMDVLSPGGPVHPEVHQLGNDADGAGNHRE